MSSRLTDQSPGASDTVSLPPLYKRGAPVVDTPLSFNTNSNKCSWSFSKFRNILTGYSFHFLFNMADSKVESSGELSAKELKEKKQADDAENGEDAAANGRTDEENGGLGNEVEEDEEDVGEDEDEEEGEGDEGEDEEDDLDRPRGKRAAEDDDDNDDEEDEGETKKQKTDK